MPEQRDNQTRVSHIAIVLLSGGIGAAATVLVISFLGSNPLSVSAYQVAFSFIIRLPAWQQFVMTVTAIALTNIVISGLVAILSLGKVQFKTRSARTKHVLNTVKEGLVWGYLNAMVWSTGAVLIQALAGTGHTVHITVLLTTALIAGCIHLPLCTVGEVYLGRIIISDPGEEDLYSLAGRALLRLYLPNGIASVGAGILFGYFATIVPVGHFFQGIYLHRFHIALLITLYSLGLYCMFYLADEGSFTRRVLTYKNVFRVWFWMLVIFLGSLLIGTVVFDHLLVRFMKVI